MDFQIKQEILNRSCQRIRELPFSFLFSQQTQKFPRSFPLRVVNRFNKISARVNSFNQFAADTSFQEKEVSHAMFGEIHSLLFSFTCKSSRR